MTPIPLQIQRLVHLLDVGSGRRWISWILGLVVCLGITALYLTRSTRNFQNPEAMEMAQVGRNLALGRGFSTHFIRPLSLQILRERQHALGLPDSKILTAPLPDLHCPPVHPLMIGGVFKLLPESLRSGLPSDPVTQRPHPESVISLLNLAWFGVGTLLVFRLGSRWFDPFVGTLAAAIYAGTELLWKLSSQGLPTPFLMVLLLLLADVLVRLDETGEPLALGSTAPVGRPLRLAVAAGALLGIGFLTRYAFGILLLPALVWMLIGHARRALVVPACLLGFALFAGPWVARNHHLSGHFLGTAFSSVSSGTISLPDSTLERHLRPPAQQPDLGEIRYKFETAAGDLLRNAVPKIGGNWILFFFVAGIALPFRNVRMRRLRWFTLGSLGTLFVVEALTRTRLESLIPEVNGGNQLVLVAPLITLFGTGFFVSLLDSTEFGHPMLRSLTAAGAWAVFSLPFIGSLLPPRSYPMADSIYRPDVIHEFCSYVKPNELLVSDVPWAVAWYGDRDCLWTPNAIRSTNGDDFLTVNDFERHIAALYLSPLTADEPLRRVAGRSASVWGRFYFDALARKTLPAGFPLLEAYQGSAEGGHLFLADKKRW